MLDPISLWAQWVEFPSDMEGHGFAPLVRCPNPEHPTEKHHFQINLDQPLVHCFANCGISGRYEHAIALIEGITEPAARKLIFKSTGVAGKRASGKNVLPNSSRGHGGNKGNAGRRRITDETEIVSIDFSTYVPQAGEEYLRGRGIDGGSIAAWGIGWDQDERRIVIPARDERGHTRFLIKRAVREQDWPKYLYAPEKELCGWGKSDLLFGACNLDLDLVRSQGLVLCEGGLDCIRLHQNGTRNAVAQLGSYLSGRQGEILSRIRPPKVYLMFDKDAAGYRAIKTANEILCKFPLFVCLYPKGKADPAEMSRKEVERSIGRAVSMVSFNSRLPERLKLRRSVANA